MEGVASDGVACPRCGTAAPAPGSAGARLQCAGCGLAFWALRREGLGAVAGAPAAAALGEAATCFFHPENAAVLSCPTCGRFVCALCDIEIEGVHACPLCFQQAQGREEVASLRRQDTLYDSMALAAGWGWVFFYPSWIFALPAVGYWTIAKWNAPRGYLIPRGRWRYGVALAGLILLPVVMAVGVGLIGMMVVRRMQGR